MLVLVVPSLRKSLTLVRFVRTFASLVRNPNQLDRVFALGDNVATGDLFEVMPWMRGRPEIEAVARGAVPRLRCDRARLSALPPGTLGRAYIDFMDRNGLDPNALDHVRGTGSLQQFRIHLQSSHDLWHVLTGFDTDVDGEVGLQAFYFAQLQAPLPLTLISAGLLNALLLRKGSGERRVELLVRGYLMGRRAAQLTGIDWSRHLERPLVEVRRELRIEPDLDPDALATVDSAA